MRLQDLVELEGSGQDLSVLVGTGVSEIRLAILLVVRHFYRPARRMMGSAVESERASGTRRMEAFSDVMLSVSEQAEDAGDEIAHLWAIHNAASGMHWKNEQPTTVAANLFNRSVLEGAVSFVSSPGSDDEQDAKYLHLKAWSGLMEHDSDFSSLVTLDGWARVVHEMYTLRYPDFPGRALVLAKKYVAMNRVQDAIDTLDYAGAVDFGKEDQRADARTFLAELTGHRD